MKKSGFTFIELMVTLFIFSILSLSLWTVLSTGRHTWHRGRTQIELQQEIRRAMDWMTKELRPSGSGRALISSLGTTITFQVPVDWDNDGDIIDEAGGIEWGADGNANWAIQYLISGRLLLRRTLDAYPNGAQTGADRVLANSIRSDSPPPNALMFSGNLPEIEIEISAQKSALPGQLLQATLQSQVTLRN